jgi:hypothetical protein
MFVCFEGLKVTITHPRGAFSRLGIFTLQDRSDRVRLQVKIVGRVRRDISWDIQLPVARDIKVMYHLFGLRVDGEELPFL